MTRLIVAPVGLQPAAVLAPLHSPPLKPTDGDRVMLVASPDSIEAAREIKTRLGHPDCEVLESEPFMLQKEVLEKILSAARDRREAWVLINGGRGEWAEGLITALSESDLHLRVVGSRDHRGYVLDDGSEVEGFEVKDVGLETLLLFLGLRFRRRTLSRRASKGADTLQPVVGMAERSGQLFAGVDASGWELQDYRQFVLDWRRLQRLGLDYRRVLLIGLDGALAERAFQDGIPVAARRARFGRSSDLEKWKDQVVSEWRAQVAAGEAIGLPERQVQAREPRPASATRGASSWTGRTLLVIVGTQPGSTLQAIWGHRPQRLFLLYDQEQPRSCALAGRLARDVSLGVREVFPIPLPVAELLPKGLEEAAVDVNVTPGDKLDRARLLLWANASRDRRRVWLLHGDRVRSADGREERGIDIVPLDVWTRLHAPGTVELGADGTRLDRRVATLAGAIISWLAGAKADLNYLDQLWVRRTALRVDTRRKSVECPGCAAIRLSELPKEVASAFLPSTVSVQSGLWWEWVVGAALATLGVHEVRIGFRVRWSHCAQRDELDLVTRHWAQYGYWSCKTASVRSLQTNLEEARAQADRLLGRQRLAVLVVPRVTSVPPGMEAQGVGHWWKRELGHLVDARFLSDRAGVLALARRDDFHAGRPTTSQRRSDSAPRP